MLVSMVIERMVEIPVNHQLHLDIPSEFLAGDTATILVIGPGRTAFARRHRTPQEAIEYCRGLGVTATSDDFLERRRRMQYKIFFYVIFSFFSLMPVYPADDILSIGFPNMDNMPLLDKYISNKIDLPRNKLYQEYKYILSFLDKYIVACKENIFISLNENSIKYIVPVVSEDNLSFQEIEKYKLIWNDLTGQDKRHS